MDFVPVTTITKQIYYTDTITCPVCAGRNEKRIKNGKLGYLWEFYGPGSKGMLFCSRECYDKWEA
jgi:hypothetical protein